MVEQQEEHLVCKSPAVTITQIHLGILTNLE